MLVEARGLTKVYPMGVTALDGVDLTVERGEILGIMGRSGSGKSTLLHLLGCLDRPTSGSVAIEGVDVTRLPAGALPALRLKRVGFVFQAHNLVRTLTALENVALPLRYRRPRPGDAMEKARAALEAVGLADRMHHLPSQLSGGQQQRVAIARALVNEPSLVLADEPTGALDSQTARELLALLRRLCTERGQTFVIVTHDALVAQACDRVITMADGRVAGVRM
ncbi:MAG: transporter ATP-binding protein [Symbiobacteriaceae bacterium]|jgi:ABC-type lipoprotein export system ATPase subunit|nr:transporter ATP-binding protein [Symbiobacteriaceae bacterium]